MRIDLEKLIKLDEEHSKCMVAIEKDRAEIYYKNKKLNKKDTKFIKTFIDYWKNIHTICKEVLDTMIKED